MSVMTVDWLAVATRLFDCVVEPAVLIESGEKIVVHNAAFGRLVAHPNSRSLQGRGWSEALRATPADGLARAIELHLSEAEGEIETADGRRLHVVLSLMPVGESPICIARVTHHRPVDGGAGGTRSHIRYEVDWNEATRYRLRTVDASSRANVGEICYQALQGRSTPCVGCPAQQLEGQAHTAVVFSGEGREPIRLVQASRTETDNVAVDAWDVDDGVLWRLFEAKVGLLARRADLSDRERDVLLWLLRGRSAQDIGTILGITARTVKFHQANVLRKLGAESRADLLRLIF